VLTQPCQNVRVFHKGDFQKFSLFFYFVFFCFLCAVITDSGSLDNDIAVCIFLLYRFKHILCTDNLHDANSMRDVQLDRTADQCYIRPHVTGCSGNLIAHLPGGMVGNKAYRIQGLTGWSRCDQYTLSPEKSGGFQNTANAFLDMCDIRKLSFSGISAGKISNLRFHQLIAECFCGFQIFLCDWIFIHAGIHCRADHLRAVSCQKGRCEHVVRKAVNNFGNNICGCRYKDKDIRTMCNGNMFNTAIRHLFKGGNHHIVLC